MKSIFLSLVALFILNDAYAQHNNVLGNIPSLPTAKPKQQEPSKVSSMSSNLEANPALKIIRFQPTIAVKDLQTLITYGPSPFEETKAEDGFYCSMVEPICLPLFEKIIQGNQQRLQQFLNFMKSDLVQFREQILLAMQETADFYGNPSLVYSLKKSFQREFVYVEGLQFFQSDFKEYEDTIVNMLKIYQGYLDLMPKYRAQSEELTKKYPRPTSNKCKGDEPGANSCQRLLRFADIARDYNKEVYSLAPITTWHSLEHKVIRLFKLFDEQNTYDKITNQYIKSAFKIADNLNMAELLEFADIDQKKCFSNDKEINYLWWAYKQDKLDPITDREFLKDFLDPQKPKYKITCKTTATNLFTKVDRSQREAIVYYTADNVHYNPPLACVFLGDSSCQSSVSLSIKAGKIWKNQAF